MQAGAKLTVFMRRLRPRIHTDQHKQTLTHIQHTQTHAAVNTPAHTHSHTHTHLPGKTKRKKEGQAAQTHGQERSVDGSESQTTAANKGTSKRADSKPTTESSD